MESLDLVLLCGAIPALERITRGGCDESCPFLGPALATLASYRDALEALSARDPAVDAYEIAQHTVYIQVPHPSPPPPAARRRHRWPRLAGALRSPPHLPLPN